MTIPPDEGYDTTLAIRLSTSGAQRPRRKPEREVVADAVDLIVKTYRGYARKTHGGAYSQTGEPDLDACIRGRCVKLEAKAIDGRPTLPQMESMRRWSNAGALVGWFRNNTEVVEILDHLEHPGFVPDLTRPGCHCPIHAPMHDGGEAA